MRTIMDEIARVAGFEAAMRICAIWGGRSLYIPARIKPDHPIAEDLGETAAAKLAEAFGSQTINPPKMEMVDVRVSRAVRVLTQKGLSGSLIGEIVGISDQHARRLAARGKPETAGDPGDEEGHGCRRAPSSRDFQT